MSHAIMTTTGRVAWADGAPAAGIVVAIVDEDPIVDDLLGLGVTGDDGGFRLSFTRKAFNQDPFESEELPELYVVCSAQRDGDLVAIAREAFPGRTFEAGVEDLGVIRLGASKGEVPPALPAVRPVPGGMKPGARRLDLDDNLVRGVLEEMAAVVEPLTRWRGLLDGLRVETVEHAGVGQLRIVEAVVGHLRMDQARWRQELTANLAFSLGGIGALYDPFGKVIYVDRTKIERQNLDGLRVIVGHELVHVGQFAAHPELCDEHAARIREAAALPPDAPEQADIAARTAAFLANLEGHAGHIEHDFLRKVWNCATALPHLSALELGALFTVGIAALAAQSTGAWTPKAGGLATAHYALGLRAYRARRRTDRPVPFDPSFRLDAAGARRLGGDLLEGRGAAKDPKEASFWLDFAASRGDLDAKRELERLTG